MAVASELRAGNSASEREAAIRQYAPLVKYVVGRLAIGLPAILDYEDILSYGTIGLIEALDRYVKTVGHAAEMPVQASATSHTPADARHTVDDGWKVSAGHEALVPVQLSARSHTSVAVRHTVVLAAKEPYNGYQVWDSNFLPAFHKGVRVLPGAWLISTPTVNQMGRPISTEQR